MMLIDLSYKLELNVAVCWSAPVNYRIWCVGLYFYFSSDFLNANDREKKTVLHFKLFCSSQWKQYFMFISWGFKSTQTKTINFTIPNKFYRIYYYNIGRHAQLHAAAISIQWISINFWGKRSLFAIMILLWYYEMIWYAWWSGPLILLFYLANNVGHTLATQFNSNAMFANFGDYNVQHQCTWINARPIRIENQLWCLLFVCVCGVCMPMWLNQIAFYLMFAVSKRPTAFKDFSFL